MKHFFLILVTFLGLTGCNRYKDIYNVHDLMLPHTLKGKPLQEIGERISNTAAARGWSCKEKSENSLACHFQKSRHYADIRISYTDSSYSINFVDASTELLDDGRIHHNYNRWIQNLQKDISKIL